MVAWQLQRDMVRKQTGLGNFICAKVFFFSFFISLRDWPNPPLDWIYPLMKPVYIFLVDSRIEIRTK